MAVSIIMAAYNAEQYVAAAIASVKSQSFTDWELLIVDDGSLDRTAEIASDFAAEDSRIRLIKQKNSGRPGVARNAGLAIARGEWLAFLDADDVCAPRRLEKCMEVVGRATGVNFLFHDFGIMDVTGELREVDFLKGKGFPAETPIEAEVVAGGAILLRDRFRDFLMTDYVACNTATSFVHKSALGDEAVRFRTDVVVGEDLDLWLRALEKSSAIFVSQTLSFYRMSEGSVTTKEKIFKADTIKVLEFHLAHGKGGLRWETRRLVRRRLRTLHSSLGYSYLVEGNGSMARRYFGRGLLRYGGGINLLGIAKSMLPWAAWRGWVRSSR